MQSDNWCIIMRKIIIPTGTRYGNLEVVEEMSPVLDSSGQKRRVLLCKCDCGVVTMFRVGSLNRCNGPRSCGCVNRKRYRVKAGERGRSADRKNSKPKKTIYINSKKPIYFDGELRSIESWAEKIGVSYACLLARLRRGIPVERALTMMYEG